MTRSALSEYRRSVLEDDLLKTVLEAAAIYGWRVHHDRRSDLANPQWGSHTGFPDLCMVRGGRVIFCELKREGENLTEEQWAWMREMPPNSHAVTSLVVKLSNIDELIAALK